MPPSKFSAFQETQAISLAGRLRGSSLFGFVNSPCDRKTDRKTALLPPRKCPFMTSDVSRRLHARDRFTADMSAESSTCGIGQAIFIRTDTADYAEHPVAFSTLEEMVRICSKSRPNLILEKVTVYSQADGEPCALTLGFVAATKGQRPQQATPAPS
jgi:hypothetical protein